MCLSVGLSAFYRAHDISYFAALPLSTPRAGAVAGGPARAGKHAQREHAHVVQLLNEKIVALMPYKNKTVRACMLSYT